MFRMIFSNDNSMIESVIFPAMTYVLPLFVKNRLTQENLNLLARLKNTELRFICNLRECDNINEYKNESRLLTSGISCNSL